MNTNIMIAKQHGGVLLWAVIPLSAGNGQKESGGLDFSNPPPVKDNKLRVEIGLPSSVFFLFCCWADWFSLST